MNSNPKQCQCCVCSPRKRLPSHCDNIQFSLAEISHAVGIEPKTLEGVSYAALQLDIPLAGGRVLRLREGDDKETDHEVVKLPASSEYHEATRDFYVEIELYSTLGAGRVTRDVVLVTQMRNAEAAYVEVESSYNSASGRSLKRILGHREAGPFIPNP